MVAIPVVTILLVGICNFLWHRHANRHSRRLATFARRNGWAFSRAVFVPWSPWFDVVYGKGGRLKAGDCIRGRWKDTDFVAFMLYDADDKETYFKGSCLVVAIELAAILPDAYLTHGVGPGASGLGFEWHDFNATWKVDWCDDDRATHAFFAPRVMQCLMQDWPTKHLRISGNFLVTWDEEIQEPDEIKRIVESLANLVACVPRFLWME
jgi:hypothetical protein